MSDDLEIDVGDRVRFKGDLGSHGLGPTWATVFREGPDMNGSRRVGLAIPLTGGGFQMEHGIDPNAVTTEEPEPIGGEVVRAERWPHAV